MKVCLPSLSTSSSPHLPYISSCFIKLSEISSLISTACPKEVFLCLYSLYLALPSLQFSAVQMQVISRVVPLSFAIAVTHFFREVRNLAVPRLGRSHVLSFDTPSTQPYAPVRTGRDQLINSHSSAPHGRNSCTTLWAHRPSSNSGLLETDCVSRDEAVSCEHSAAVCLCTFTISSFTTCMDYIKIWLLVFHI